MKRVVTLLVAVLVAAAFTPAFISHTRAQGQELSGNITYCGLDEFGVLLRLHNPDLNPWNDPIPQGFRDAFSSAPQNDPALIEASGNLFAQFQAAVDTHNEVAKEMNLIEEIDSFWFGFGPNRQVSTFLDPTQHPDEVPDAVSSAINDTKPPCEKPWLPGIQLYSYRTDADPTDGFHVPIDTPAVPDGPYGYVLYACTESEFEDCQPRSAEESNLVAAVWGQAEVFNDRGESPQGWGNDPDPMADFIKPWPRVVPGDGDHPADFENPCDVPAEQCVTIDFTENVTRVDVFFNGINVTSELEEWTPPIMDDDLQPGNDGEQCPGGENIPPDEFPGADTFRVCRKVVWGSGWAWAAPQPFEEQDEIRVVAVDVAGNVGEKTIAFQDETRGGVIELIETDLEVDIQPKELRVRPGDSKVFEMTIRNLGEQDIAHVFPEIDAPPELDVRLGNTHIDVPPGENATVPFQAGPTAEAAEGEYPLEVRFRYDTLEDQQFKRKVKKGFATLIADDDAALSGSGNDTDVPEPLPGGFLRECTERADFLVCFRWPDTLEPAKEFTFQVETKIPADRVEDQHEKPAGDDATLRIRYLDTDQKTSVADPAIHDMEQISDGRYRTQVTLEQLSPYVRADFATEAVEAGLFIHQPDGSQTEGAEATTPGFTALALVAALGAAALLLKRRRF